MLSATLLIADLGALLHLVPSPAGNPTVQTPASFARQDGQELTVSTTWTLSLKDL